MNTQVTRMFDIEFPLFAFTHCRDVVVAVSKAGGFGVYAAGGLTNEQFEIDLKWIDDEIGGKPYGVDLLIPNKSLAQDEKFDAKKLKTMIPKEYGDFRADILEKHGIDGSDFRSFEEDDKRGMGLAKNTKEQGAKNIVDIALNHPIALIVNALGVAGKFGSATQGFTLNSKEDLSSDFIFCRAKSQEYNYSSNPSFISSSTGAILFDSFIDNPTTYITTVGLYNDSQELLAVAKLSRPLEKDFTKELLVRVKLDF